MHVAHEIEDHDRGLAFDLQTIARRQIERRRALRWFASAGSVAFLTSCGGSGESSTTGGVSVVPTPTPTSTTPTPTTSTPTPSTSNAACAVPASETAGPYPADGSNTSRGSTSNVLTSSGVIRQDLRSSFVGLTTLAAGVRLDITITVTNANAACAPLAGYAVYLWHCDKDGNYSLYDLPAESYLRGVGVTNAQGQVTFTTVIPGCYAGRYPHMHFEVFSSLSNATAGRFAVLTSQLALSAATCREVYSGSSLYSTSLSRFNATSIASDNVFGDNSAVQMAVMTPTVTGSVAAGYTATTTIGIAT